MREDAGRGWRHVVPSPRPLRILNIATIAYMLKGADVVIAAGGGGIPVVRGRDGQWRGVEAVIDKDYASALLAIELQADLYVVLTGVPQVSIPGAELDGLPVGLSIVGSPGSDATLVAVAAALTRM